MCKKCKANPQNRNTRYCDDWWNGISHGGYNEDRRIKEEIDIEEDAKYESGANLMATWGDGDYG